MWLVGSCCKLGNIWWTIGVIQKVRALRGGGRGTRKGTRTNKGGGGSKLLSERTLWMSP